VLLSSVSRHVLSLQELGFGAVTLARVASNARPAEVARSVRSTARERDSVTCGYSRLLLLRVLSPASPAALLQCFWILPSMGSPVVFRAAFRICCSPRPHRFGLLKSVTDVPDTQTRRAAI
jgi:hypothetical protein